MFVYQFPYHAGLPDVSFTPSPTYLYFQTLLWFQKVLEVLIGVCDELTIHAL